MSTANFAPMEYGMPLVCGNPTDDEWEAMDEYERAEKLAEDFTDGLTFHDVTIKCGYYEGFQFYVEERYSGYFDLDKDSRHCIDNEEAHDYFDMCRSRALRAADAEKRKIARWLEKLTEYGFDIYVITVRFSNGETWYKRKTPRTELLAAARA